MITKEFQYCYVVYLYIHSSSNLFALNNIFKVSFHMCSYLLYSLSFVVLNGAFSEVPSASKKRKEKSNYAIF